MRRSLEELGRVTECHVLPKLKQFKDRFRTQYPTFQFWLTFLDACEHLLHHTKAERIGDWSLHLHANAKMLHYLRATNHHNYSRWLPVYILDMLTLPSDVAEAYRNGQFSIRDTPNPFNGIWADMAVEKSIIRDAKNNSGIAYHTPTESAVLRWGMTRHVIGAYAATIKERSGLATTEERHSENQPAKMIRDEQHAEMLIYHVKENMINPLMWRNSHATFWSISLMVFMLRRRFRTHSRRW